MMLTCCKKSKISNIQDRTSFYEVIHEAWLVVVVNIQYIHHPRWGITLWSYTTLEWSFGKKSNISNIQDGISFHEVIHDVWLNLLWKIQYIQHPIWYVTLWSYMTLEWSYMTLEWSFCKKIHYIQHPRRDIIL